MPQKNKIFSQNDILNNAKKFLILHQKDDSSGHDYYHSLRVAGNARLIAQQERADVFVCQLAALLHDLDDVKISPATNKGLTKTRLFFSESLLEKKLQERIINIIQKISFKGAGVDDKTDSLEEAVVQDADRLDALGAIGVARTFAYGGAKNRPMFDPAQKPVMHKLEDEYYKSEGCTVNHFYEKLFLLKERMKTKSGRIMAEDRDRFVKNFLKQFLTEWESGEEFAD